MSEQKRKKSKWLLWVTIASAVIFLISPVVLYRMKQRAAFNRTLRELSEAGYPTTNEELQAMHVLPEGVENAADIYQKAFAVYHEPNEADRPWLPYQGDYEAKDGEPYPQEVLDAIARSLKQNAECLELLDQAAQIEHCLFPVEFKGYATLFNHFMLLRESSKLLADRNILFAYTGENQVLFRSLQVSIMITKTKSAYPNVADHFVTNRNKRLINESIEKSLSNVVFSSKQLMALQQKLHEMSQFYQLDLALCGEVACYVDLRERPLHQTMKNYTGCDPDFYEKAKLFLNDFTGRIDKDCDFGVDLYKQCIEITKLSSHQQLAKADMLQKSEEAHLFCTKITDICFPIFRIFEYNLHTIGFLRCGETAMAIERYRLKYGCLPESLEALVPEFIDAVRLDPFDGTPIRYNILETGGYRLYTVGEDGVDNGGIDEDHKPAGSDEYDYPFTVYRDDNNDQ